MHRIIAANKEHFLQPMLRLTVRKWAVLPDHLRSEISFSRTCNIPLHWKSTKTRRSYLN